MSPRFSGALGALLVAVAIGAGAFGAHTLEGRIPAARLETLGTAVSYQVYAGIGLVVMSLIGSAAFPALATAAKRAAALLASGAVLFCGALYALVAGGPGIFGLVAPFGGAAMIAAWAYLAFAFLRERVTPAR